MRGEERDLRRGRGENRNAADARPAILEIETPDRAPALGPGVDRLRQRATRLLGNAIDFGNFEAGVARIREEIYAGIVAHEICVEARGQLFVEFALDFAFEQHEFAALMRTAIEDVLKIGEVYQAHVGTIVAREASNRGLVVEMIIEP